MWPWRQRSTAGLSPTQRCPGGPCCGAGPLALSSSADGFYCASTLSASMMPPWSEPGNLSCQSAIPAWILSATSWTKPWARQRRSWRVSSAPTLAPCPSQASLLSSSSMPSSRQELFAGGPSVSQLIARGNLFGEVQGGVCVHFILNECMYTVKHHIHCPLSRHPSHTSNPWALNA